LAQRKGTRRRR